jgi:hypothetical protein
MRTKRNKPFSLRLKYAAAALCLALTAAPSLLHAQQQKQPTERLVEGTVTGKSDQPLAGAVVYIKDTKTLTIKSYLTDDKGHFRFGQLSLSTDYDLWADNHGVHSKTKHVSPFNNKSNLEYTLKIDAD